MPKNNLSRSLITILLVLFLTALTACSDDNDSDNSAGTIAGTITVSAAASLTDAMREIAEQFTEENPDVQIDYNFGGSGALKQQILHGAPADLFFSASASDFQAVVDEGFINKENALDLLANELVLIVPEGNDTVTSFDDLSDVKQIAIGNPESVPAGAYSAEAFASMDMMEELEALFVYAEDVRAVLTYVETGNVDAGIVYKTDAIISEKVEIVDAAPADSHTPITYPAGLMNESDNAEAARAFFEYLQTNEALKVFEEYGFVIQ